MKFELINIKQEKSINCITNREIIIIAQPVGNNFNLATRQPNPPPSYFYLIFNLV